MLLLVLPALALLAAFAAGDRRLRPIAPLVPAHDLLTAASTNVEHMTRDPLTVLTASAFWLVGSHLRDLVLFGTVLAIAERLLGTCACSSCSSSGTRAGAC
jgi:hypothetical protein